jgi:adenylate cyclase
MVGEAGDDPRSPDSPDPELFDAEPFDAEAATQPLDLGSPTTGPIDLPRFDSERLYDAVERVLFGQARHLSRLDVLRLAGVTPEHADALWRALGFTVAASDDEVRFVDADIEALRVLGSLIETGLVEPEAQYALARSMGRSFARLAEWEIAEIAGSAVTVAGEGDLPALEETLAFVLPIVERLQDYTWRRHLANAAGRLLLQPDAIGGGVRMAVGFADIVGYTRRSRSMTAEELAELVETFDATVGTVISDHGGRVIKTIGDEVMFAADDRQTAARIALALAEGSSVDELFPEVRVGVAYGDVLRRLGDVFGEVVNIASRLTSLARPGRVLMNDEMAEGLRLDEEFRVRRARTSTVKGYSRLESWSLKRPKPPPDELAAEKELDRAEREARRALRRETRREVRREVLAEPIEALESLAERLNLNRRPVEGDDGA